MQLSSHTLIDTKSHWIKLITFISIQTVDSLIVRAYCLNLLFDTRFAWYRNYYGRTQYPCLFRYSSYIFHTCPLRPHNDFHCLYLVRLIIKWFKLMLYFTAIRCGSDCPKKGFFEDRIDWQFKRNEFCRIPMQAFWFVTNISRMGDVNEWALL